MCTEYVEEKKELLRAIAKDRKLSDLPKISQVSIMFNLLQCRVCKLAIYIHIYIRFFVIHHAFLVDGSQL